MKKFIIIISFLLILPNFCQAAKLSDWGSTLTTFSKNSGYNTGTDTNQVINLILKAVFSLLGVFFLSLMIYGGFLWMTDRGSSQQVEKAQKLISAAVIGIIIVLASYAISYFVLEKISDKTLKQTTDTYERH